MTSRTPRGRFSMASVLFTAGLLLAACGSDGTETGSEGSGASTDQTEATNSDSPATFTGLADFEPACRGIKVEGAPEYVADDGLNFITAFSGEDPDFEQLYGVLADGWEPEFDTEKKFEDYAKTELVACVDRIETVEGELCEGYQDDDAGNEWTVMTYGGTYQIKLRSTDSAEVIAETTLSADPGDCPMFSSYTEGEDLPIEDYELPVDAIQGWLADYVQGA